MKDLKAGETFIHSFINYDLKDERDLGVRLKTGLDLKDIKAVESLHSFFHLLIIISNLVDESDLWSQIEEWA